MFLQASPFLVLCLVSSVLGGATTLRPGGNQPDHDGTERFNEFDWKLTKAIGQKAKSNVIISPISVKLVLAMLYEGAGGNTAKQLQQALNIVEQRVPSMTRSLSSSKLSDILKSLQAPNDGYDLDVGTKVFMDKEARPLINFEKKIQDLYNATIDKIDFKNTAAAVEHINAWAKAVTRGHIKKLLSEADTKDSIVLLLLNAVYFKGIWEHKFPVAETVPGKFYLDDKSTVDVEYMNAVHSLKYIESTELGAKIIRLPYVGQKFAMYIILPFDSNGLKEVMNNIDPQKLRNVLPQMQPITARLKIPKFKIEYAASLAPFLKLLGLTDMFSTNADFNGIAVSSKELVVSNVIQKVGLEVNEQGSTAYVVTEVDLVSKFGEYVADFNATHPFVFFIEDETTKTIVFVGKINDPIQTGKTHVAAGQQNPSGERN